MLLRWSFLFLLTPSFMQGQNLSAKVFFNTDSIPCTYLGIDFTLTRLVGDNESVSSVITTTQFNGINDLIVKEFKKYDVQEAYRRINWTVDLKEVEAKNLKADPDSLKSTNENSLYRLNDNDISQLVQNFNYGGHKGYGVLLIVEGMSKSAKIATVWFTLIDMNSKKLLFTAREQGKLGSGFGFRNYWASAIKNAIKNARDDYDKWQTGVVSK